MTGKHAWQAQILDVIRYVLLLQHPSNLDEVTSRENANLSTIKTGSIVSREIASEISGVLALSPFLIGRMFLREPSWKYSAKLVGSYLGQLFFANLVGSIRRSYIRGPKSFAQHVLGTFALEDDHCL